MATTTTEKKFWDKYGSIYNYLEESTPYRKLVSDFFEGLEFNESANILDVGTGSGYLVDKLISNYGNKDFHIDAVDLSPVMLEHLKNRLDKHHPEQAKKIDYRVLDISKPLDYEDEVYDLILANLVVTYIEDFEGIKGKEALRKVLQEMYRVLKTGGEFRWSTPKKGVHFINVFLASWVDLINPKNYYLWYYGPKILMHALRIEKKGKLGDYTFLSDTELTNLLHDIGFKDILIRKSFANQAIIISCKK